MLKRVNPPLLCIGEATRNTANERFMEKQPRDVLGREREVGEGLAMAYHTTIRPYGELHLIRRWEVRVMKLKRSTITRLVF